MGIQKLLEEERQNREFLAETKLKELEGIDERLASRLSQASSARQEGEERLLKYIDEKFSILHADLHFEGSSREKDIDKTSRGVEENLSKLNEAIKIATIEREENDGEILRRIGEGLEGLDSKVKTEKAHRESSEQAVYDLLKDVVSRVKVKSQSNLRMRSTMRRRTGNGQKTHSSLSWKILVARFTL